MGSILGVAETKHDAGFTRRCDRLHLIPRRSFGGEELRLEHAAPDEALSSPDDSMNIPYTAYSTPIRFVMCVMN